MYEILLDYSLLNLLSPINTHNSIIYRKMTMGTRIKNKVNPREGTAP